MVDLPFLKGVSYFLDFRFLIIKEGPGDCNLIMVNYLLLVKIQGNWFKFWALR